MQYRAATSSGPGERTSLTDRFLGSASAPERYRAEDRIVAYLERNDGTVSDGASELGLGEWLARMFEDAPSRNEAKRCADRIASDIRGRRVASVPHQREARDGAYWMGLEYSLAETVEAPQAALTPSAPAAKAPQRKGRVSRALSLFGQAFGTLFGGGDE